MNVRGDDNSNATLTTTLLTNDELKKSLATIRARKAAPSWWLDQLPSMMRGHETKLTRVHKTTHNFRARNQNKKKTEREHSISTVNQTSFISELRQKQDSKNTHTKMTLFEQKQETEHGQNSVDKRADSNPIIEGYRERART